MIVPDVCAREKNEVKEEEERRNLYRNSQVLLKKTIQDRGVYPHQSSSSLSSLKLLFIEPQLCPG